MSSNFIFLLGNLIIIMVLVTESKSFSSNPINDFTDIYYEYYISHKTNQIHTSHEKTEKKTDQPFKENAEDSVWRSSQENEKGSVEINGLAAEELNKRADNFIGRGSLKLH
ncbi:hypothetical protein LINPERHAP1_LOCUS21109 [Linum perenne]